MGPSSRRQFCPECAKEIHIRTLVEGAPTFNGREYCSTDCAIDAYQRARAIEEIEKLEALYEEPKYPSE